MKRDELKALGLTDEQIDAVMKSHGQDVESERKKYADYDELKSQLENANKTIEGFADYDENKAAVAKYKAEAEAARKESADKLAEYELNAKVKDYTGAKKFVNDFTRGAINSQLADALRKDENKGKSLDDLFKSIVGDAKNIIVDENQPQPPKMGGMGGGTQPNAEEMAIAKARAVMHLPPLKDN